MIKAEIINIMQHPYNILLLSLFTINLYYHATLGLQIVVEDYLHVRIKKILLLFLINALSIVTSAAVVIALLYLMIV